MKKTIAVLAASALTLSMSTSAFAQNVTAPAEPEVVSQDLMAGSAGLSTAAIVGGIVAVAFLAVALSNTDEDRVVTTTTTTGN